MEMHKGVLHFLPDEYMYCTSSEELLSKKINELKALIARAKQIAMEPVLLMGFSTEVCMLTRTLKVGVRFYLLDETSGLYTTDNW